MCVYTRVCVRVYACGYVCKRSFRTEPIKATWRMAKYTRRPQLVRYYVWMSYTRLLCINNTEMNLQLRAQSLVFPSRILCESIRQPYNDRSMPINLFKSTLIYTRDIFNLIWKKQLLFSILFHARLNIKRYSIPVLPLNNWIRKTLMLIFGEGIVRTDPTSLAFH